MVKEPLSQADLGVFHSMKGKFRKSLVILSPDEKVLKILGQSQQTVFHGGEVTKVRQKRNDTDSMSIVFLYMVILQRRRTNDTL